MAKKKSAVARRQRRKLTAGFKARVAFAAASRQNARRVVQTVREVHPNQISNWNRVKSRVGARHHPSTSSGQALHSDSAWLCLSDSGGGCGEPPGTGT